MALGIYFPFQETQAGGVFRPTKTTYESVRSNLIAFFTLRRGQRPMNNQLYSPLYDYIFEQFDSIAEDQLLQDIKEKMAQFFPNVELKGVDISFTEETNTVATKIIYSIPSLGTGLDSINIEVENIN